MKRKLSEQNASAAIMDAIFKQADKNWEGIWSTVSKLQASQEKPPIIDKGYAKFNFTLAAIAINMRSAFDVLERDQAERISVIFFQLIDKFLGTGAGGKAVQNSLVKYTEAYNEGILQIRNPVLDVAMLLYYKMGLLNVEQTVVNESYYAPNPKMVEYIASALMMFSGKWEALMQRFDIVKGPSDKK